MTRESFADDKRLTKDLSDAVAVTIALWEERNRDELALYSPDGLQNLIDDALFDLTSEDEDDGEIQMYECEKCGYPETADVAKSTDFTCKECGGKYVGIPNSFLDREDLEPHEPIGEEAFENSYISTGSPDWENM